ncbi:Juxtaposed with another zinc finger protein 1 [Anabarilius grahami]|uniref:Juxtaposed with another zinc finger protein 1 n=1 Tax=Anabarilius grahami TaxID=495550 RepID=A0A3N0YHZ4_ANAGA|nr:Juxtaposed with another zinc finger protein 1 [Anabarilius grahami]
MFVSPVPPPPPAPPSCCFAPHPPPIGCQPSKQLQLQSPPPLLLQRAAGYWITPILHSLCLRRSASSRISANTFIMTGVAAASFFSNVCRFGGCGLHFESLGELIVHIEDNHIGEEGLIHALPTPESTLMRLRQTQTQNVNGIKYHAKNGHRTQIRVRKPFKCRCGKSYKTSQGLRHHTINFHPPL